MPLPMAGMDRIRLRLPNSSAKMGVLCYYTTLLLAENSSHAVIRTMKILAIAEQ